MEKTIKENSSFRLRVRKQPCMRPEGLFNLEFIQEQLKDGQVTDVSTYQFFMTDQELESLCQGLK